MTRFVASNNTVIDNCTRDEWGARKWLCECFCDADALELAAMLNSAIATEARRAETTGSVHEGADPKGIAQ